jgi:hypothetical protein
VFKVKKDEQGTLRCDKARLIVKGYAQQQGIDYEEVFALVARMEVVRLLLALAASEGLTGPSHGCEDGVSEW